MFGFRVLNLNWDLRVSGRIQAAYGLKFRMLRASGLGLRQGAETMWARE